MEFKFCDNDFEIRSCPVCLHPYGRFEASEGPFELFSCRCGMLYTRNPIKVDRKRDFYDAMADSRKKLGISYHNLATQIRSVPLYSSVIAHLHCLIGNKKNELNIVDLGCAGGLFLLGLQVAESELASTINLRGVAFERGEKIATEMYTGTSTFIIEEAGEKLQSWADVVTMLNVLEHVNHPIDCLNTIRLILKQSGLLVIDVPNNFVMIGKSRIMRKWPHLDIGEHINHFTPQTLDQLLTSQGFEPIRRLPGLVQGASGFGSFPSLKQQLRWIIASVLYFVTHSKLQMFPHMTMIYRQSSLDRLRCP